MFTRRSAFAIAVLAVILWIAGIAITGTSDNLSDSAADQQVLDWVQGNKTPILLGFWIFALGSLAFVWFLTVVRAQLADGTLPNLFYATAVGAAVLSMLTQADAVSAIQDDNNITPSAAAAMHHFGDLPFMAAELALMVAFAAFAVHALRTRIVPRWWAYVTLVVAVVLLIGPIGWAALIFGTPIWALVTGWMLSGREAASAAPAVA